MTLREILAEHPEWADLDIAVVDNVGELHYLGASGMVYDQDEVETVGEDGSVVLTGKRILVFTGN